MKQQEEIQETANTINQHVLLIEDNAICQRVMKEQLIKCGYQVDAVNDGFTNINKLHEQTFNLIVADLRLPIKSGKELIKAARESEHNVATPIILATAQIDKNDFKTYLNLGADAVLSKPFSVEKLKKTIQACCLMPDSKQQIFNKINLYFKALKKKSHQPHTVQEAELFIRNLLLNFDKNLKELREETLLKL